MRLNHVTLIVSDLDRSINFYRKLGFVPIVHEAPRSSRDGRLPHRPSHRTGLVGHTSGSLGLHPRTEQKHLPLFGGQLRGRIEAQPLSLQGNELSLEPLVRVRPG